MGTDRHTSRSYTRRGQPMALRHTRSDEDGQHRHALLCRSWRLILKRRLPDQRSWQSEQTSLPFESAPASPPGHFSMEPRVHDFENSLAPVNSFADAPWGLDIYRKAFPTQSPLSASRTTAGLIAPGSIASSLLHAVACARWTKKFARPTWSDILLEQWSDEGRHSPGWVQNRWRATSSPRRSLSAGDAICSPWRLYSAPGGRKAGNGSAATANAGR